MRRHRPEPRKAAKQDRKTAKDHQEPSADQRGERASHDPSIVEPHASDNEHRAAERRFWGRQIRISRGLNWITAAAAAAGIGALVLVFFQLKAAEQSNGYAQKSFVIGNQAFVYMSGTSALEGLKPYTNKVVYWGVDINYY